MPGHWVRATRTVTCTSDGCEMRMQRDELIYLVGGIAIQITCPRCAQRRFQKQPPTDLPHLAPVITAPPRPRTLLVADPDQPFGRPVVDNWGSVGRKAAGELKRMRRQQRTLNARDPKLRQMGSDR